MKVLWLFNHPAPYKVDLFNLLGRNIELTALFERVGEKGRNELFYSRPALSFRALTCRGLTIGGYQSFSLTPIDLIESEDFDLIVINGYSTFTEMKAISYLKKRKIPYVFCINGGVIRERESALKRKIKTSLMRGATHYLCPDEASAEYLVHYGAERERITLYPYSTVFESEILSSPLPDTERRRIAKEEFGIEAERIFVSAGQFIKRKNLECLIDIWRSVPSSYRLLLVGEGEEKEKYERLIRKLGLGNIELLPYLRKEKLLRLFSSADAFLFPTKEDIYGHVVNESLSSALRVISSPYSNAAKKLIKEGENGFIVDFDDKEAVLKAMEKAKSLSRENCLEVAKANSLEESERFFISYFEGLAK